MLTEPSGRTSSARSRGAPAMAATALTGEPFWIAAISGPEPSPMSIESPASACCSRAPPDERRGFDLDAVFAEQADPHADIERHEGERLRHRFADAQQLGRGAEVRRSDEEQRREQRANAGCLIGMTASEAMLALVPGAAQHGARSAKWCAADPGPFQARSLERSRLCGAPLRAAPRPGKASSPCPTPAAARPRWAGRS